MIYLFTKSNRINYLLLALLVITGLATCTKDSDNSAKYQFKSENNKCTGIRINGSYSIWQTLTDSNTIDVDAYVTKKGTYDISTNINNGIEFKASGIILDTGEYTFRLVGTGTPPTRLNTKFTLSSPDQKSCSFVIPIADYSDTLNSSEYAWEFYDYQDYHHGHVDSSYSQEGSVPRSVFFIGTESTNSNAFFRMRITKLELLTPGWYTWSAHRFEYVVNQDTIFISNLSTMIIDSYNWRTGVAKGRFYWDNLRHLIVGRFHVKLAPLPD